MLDFTLVVVIVEIVAAIPLVHRLIQPIEPRTCQRLILMADDLAYQSVVAGRYVTFSRGTFLGTNAGMG